MVAKKPSYKIIRNYDTKEIAEEVAKTLSGEWHECIVKTNEKGYAVYARNPIKPASIQLMSIWASGYLHGKYGEYRG